jgi:hypothetical protein
MGNLLKTVGDLLKTVGNLLKTAGNQAFQAGQPVPPLSEIEKQSLKAANSILVGAALIATITYATWVLLLFNDVTHHKAVKVFWVCNSLAFYLAIITVWLCLWAVWPYDELMHYPVNSIKNRARCPAFVFGLSFSCVVAAYSSGAYVSVPKETLGFLITDGYILVTIVVGIVLCVITIAVTLFLSYF